MRTCRYIHKKIRNVAKVNENTDLEVWGNEFRSKSDFPANFPRQKSDLRFYYLSKESLMALLTIISAKFIKKEIEEILVEKYFGGSQNLVKKNESLIKHDKLPSRLRPLVECCMAE